MAKAPPLALEDPPWESVALWPFVVLESHLLLPCVRFLVGGKVAGIGVQSFPPGDLKPLSLEPHSFEATHGPLSPGKCERVVVSSALILHSISSTQVMQVHGLPESGFPAGFCSEAGWMVHGFCFCLASHSGKGLTLGTLSGNEWMGGGLAANLGFQ